MDGRFSFIDKFFFECWPVKVVFEVVPLDVEFKDGACLGPVEAVEDTDPDLNADPKLGRSEIWKRADSTLPGCALRTFVGLLNDLKKIIFLFAREK